MNISSCTDRAIVVRRRSSVARRVLVAAVCLPFIIFTAPVAAFAMADDLLAR